MIFGPDTHTDDFLQGHTGRFWRHHLRARGDICKRSGVRVLFEPPFFKAPYKRCLFCWVAFPSLVGISILFLSVQVLERFIRATKKVRNGLFSLTANFARSKNYFMRYLARKLSFKSCALKNRSLAGEHKTTILI